MQAVSYYRLGLLADDLERPQQAADWYARALVIVRESATDPGSRRPTISWACSPRTWVGQTKLPTGSRGWLAIEGETGDRVGMALTYSQLGLLAEEQGRPGEALAGVSVDHGFVRRAGLPT